MMHLPGRLIFVKPKKVGGSSMEFLLSSTCDAGDTFTPLSVAEDCLRYQAGYQLPANVFPSAADEQSYHEAIRWLCRVLPGQATGARVDGGVSEARERAKLLRQRARIREHASLRDIRDFVGPQTFRMTPLVSICRHPYELAVSQASWNLRKGEAGSFEEALDAVVARPHVNLRRYGLHRRWRGASTPFTLILRLEELRDELRLLAALIGTEFPEELPRLKGNVRKDGRPAEIILTHAQKQAMERHNRPLFELWDNPPRP